MSKTLVVVESPAKAKTINRLLGKDYVVKASMGHIRDLPEKSLGVDIANRFEPQYVAIADREKTLAELRAAAKKADQIFLAPDPDREGEAIAWHLREAMAKGPEDFAKFHRVTYNEITAGAIRRAFENPGEINQPRVDSQQARRILDRVVGYKVSPILRRNIRGAASAGRVQSVALRLICEREEIIQNFIPEPYWVLGVRAAKQTPPTDPFLAKLWKLNGETAARIKDEKTAADLHAALQDCTLRVADLTRTESARRAPPPFITSTLQQAASSAFGMTASRTMKVAQQLYEGVNTGEGGPIGLITYMRTDSVTIAQDARNAARTVIASLYGEAYIPEKPNFFKNRSHAQEAHEAIRPTDPARTPASLKDILSADDWRLYDLIWRRFMASQMAAARIAQRQAIIEPVDAAGRALPAQPLFRSTADEILFPGWMKAAGVEKLRKSSEERSEDDDEPVDDLPALEIGEALNPVEWLHQRKETQPPSRYTEAALVKALEENGVGRPSTYAQIITTLLGRKYATREKRTLIPTPLGMEANTFLVKELEKLFNVQFTAHMEEQLDEIEEGKIGWRDMMADFYTQFQDWIKAARGPDAESAEVQRLLDALTNIQEWREPVSIGKRTYSDERFVNSIRTQHLEGTRPVSQRQLDALKRIGATYAGQIPADIREQAGIRPQDVDEAARVQDDASAKQLALLEGIQFPPPRQIGARTFSDEEFYLSLKRRVAEGRALTEAQAAHLQRMILRYISQIPDGQNRAAALGITSPDPALPAENIAGIFGLFDHIKTWNPPTERKGRTWDDKDFYTSLKEQYEGSGNLSFKQGQALKRLASIYAAQIPDYAEVAKKYNLPAQKKEKAPAHPKSKKSAKPKSSPAE